MTRARGGSRRARPTPGVVGRNVLRREGREKLTGEAIYAADLDVDGAWWGLTVRSPHPRARLLGIDRSAAEADGEAIVLTAADLATRGYSNVVRLIRKDQPFLAVDEVFHAEEPVALIAAPTRTQAERAAARLAVRYGPSKPTLDPERARKTYASYSIDKGNVEPAFARAATIVEGSYRFGSQEHVYIEPNGVVAWPSDSGVRVVRGSMQCPFYVVGALSGLFGEPESAIRVIQTTTGGGFGGKEEYPNLIAGHAALLADACGRPVRLLYDRAEDLAATTKRHPGRVRIRSALDREGRLTALDIDVLLDGGAYVTLSPVVLSRAVLHAAGPYRCPNVRIRGRVVRTNHPPFGAFRGFGVPQVAFALERHMDRLARAAGIHPAELRRRNLLADGETTATGQAVVDAGASGEALEAALDRARWSSTERAHAAFNRRHATKRRGLGLASYFHGTGFTGNGEIELGSVAALELLDEARVRVLASSTEIGQGTRTVFAQIVAQALGLPYERIETDDPDTARVPDSGPTVASRTVAVVGRILVDAARELDRALAAAVGRSAGSPWSVSDFARATARHLASGGGRRFEARFSNPARQRFDARSYRGDAYAAYAWAATVVEVEVDLVTFEVAVLRVVSAQEIGRAIHPRLAAGQIEGGLAQALGWGLMEEVVLRDGHMANAQLTNYVLPTAVETPPIDVVFLERPFAHGPFGAKGIGELPMDGGAPAAVNAIARALDVDLTEIPATPERIAAAWAAARSTESRP
ncbi:MAG: xanthine dehydrogenase family protein [Acidobacteria bacterium]|nr:xanthine dehydrogenase family protein [Acidobacteriota bacterium]